MQGDSRQETLHDARKALDQHGATANAAPLASESQLMVMVIRL